MAPVGFPSFFCPTRRREPDRTYFFYLLLLHKAKTKGEREPDQHCHTRRRETRPKRTPFWLFGSIFGLLEAILAFRKQFSLSEAILAFWKPSCKENGTLSHKKTGTRPKWMPFLAFWKPFWRFCKKPFWPSGNHFAVFLLGLV